MAELTLPKIVQASNMMMAAIAMLSLSACGSQRQTIGPQVNPDEVAAEKALEDKAVAEAKANGGVPKLWHGKPHTEEQFVRVAENIEKSGADICRDMGLPAKHRSCYYYFKISGGSDINAHADGTSVVINRGMMRFVANDDELACVVGHELAHNLMDHMHRKGTDIVVGEVLGAALDAMAYGRGYNTGGGGATVGGTMAVAAYSPDFEREADYVGAYITARAGYNISNCLHFWRNLSVQEPTAENGGITHPSNPERFVAMQKTIAEIDYKRQHSLPLVPNTPHEETLAADTQSVTIPPSVH